METIRVINSNGKVKHVTKAVAEEAAPKHDYWVEDPNWEVINGKIVKKQVPDIVKKAVDGGTQNPDPPKADGGTQNPKPPTEESLGGTQNPKPPTKDEIFAKYLPDYDGKPHWRNVVKVIEESTIEEATIIIQTENSKAVLKAFEQKQS